MRLLILTMIFLGPIVARGQDRGEILINGNKIEVPADIPDHFSFKTSSATLNENGKTYLDYFGAMYKNKLQPTDTLLVTIYPTSTKKEQGINNKTIIRRAATVKKYIEKKFDIKITKMRLRETVTSCVLVAVPTRKGYIIKNIIK